MNVDDEVLVLAPVVMRIFLQDPDSDGMFWAGEIKATFVYNPLDPLAVHLDMREPNKVTTWTFARDLLDRGLRRGTGDGDVWIGRRYKKLRMLLDSPNGCVEAFCLLAPVREFLERTYVVTPVEYEMVGFDDHIERELYEMLREEESEG